MNAETKHPGMAFDPDDARLTAYVLGELGGSFAHVEFHSLPEGRLREVVAWREAYERRIRGVLDEGIEAGIVRAAVGKLAALSLLGALIWTAVWWRPDGSLGVASNPNGSVAHIAGVRNEAGNVMGLMPHPEHAVEALTGGTDGLVILGSLADAVGAGR